MYFKYCPPLAMGFLDSIAYCFAARVFTKISVSRYIFQMRFGVFIEPSKLDEMTLRFSKYSNRLSNDVTGNGDELDALILVSMFLVTIESRGVNGLWE